MRVNVDDALFADERFKIFSRIVGDEDKAVGIMVRLYRLGQSYWKSGKLIPESIFVAGGFQPVLDCDLAEKRGHGVYVRGSDDRWDWLLAVEAKAKLAGKASAEARKKKYGSSNPRLNAGTNAEQAFTCSPEQDVNNVNNSGTKRELDVNPPDIAPAPALVKEELSICGDVSPQTPKRKRKPKVETEKSRTETAEVWAAYKKAYAGRYQEDPPYSPKYYSMCKNIISRLGFSAALEVVRFYLTLEDQWFLKNYHVLDYCTKHAEALHMRFRKEGAPPKEKTWEEQKAEYEAMGYQVRD